MHACVDALTPGQRRVLEAFCAGQLPAGQLTAALERARVEQRPAPAPPPASAPPPAPAVAAEPAALARAA
jgi:hypothetical protein